MSPQNKELEDEASLSFVDLYGILADNADDIIEEWINENPEAEDVYNGEFPTQTLENEASNDWNPDNPTSMTNITFTGTPGLLSPHLNMDGKDLIISACWAAGAVVGLLPLFGWHAAVDESPGCYFVEVMDYNYLLFLYFATIVTPSVLLAGFYAHIYRVVVKQMSAVVTVEGGLGREGTMLRVLGAAQKREVKATQNLAIIVFFFIICWIPLYTINAIKAFMPALDIPNPLTYFCIIFSHLNSAINPLLYAYHLKDFRAALKGLICAILGRGVPIPAAYRPPVPIRRPALERCNALRERPKIYVDSPVWRRQKEAEIGGSTGRVVDCEPFLNIARDNSSGRYTPEAHEGTNGPYLIESSLDCQSPYKKVENFIRKVRSVNVEPS